MTSLDKIVNLDNYEDDDIFDVVLKLEKSFGLKFEKNAFANVKTFGDLCDVFETHINYQHQNDCTKQQAFYRVRSAIATTQNISIDKIKPDTKLEDLFLFNNRRKKIKAFSDCLGINIKTLTYPGWLAMAFVVGFLLSILAFFFDWRIALGGIIFFISAMKLSERSGKSLSIKTVRELTEKLSRENYIDIRRTSKTVNRKEISQTIIETFSNELSIDKVYLTREAKFG